MAKKKAQVRVKLSPNAYAAYRELDSGKYTARANRLRKTEVGFGLLLLWNVVEMMLKLIRYNDKLKDGWPDKLNFINANWEPLKRIKGLNATAYNNILGSQKSSLWKYRNQIAHTGKEVETEKADLYWSDANFLIARLVESLPNKQDVLTKKRRSDAQLKRKKN
jgi:hypothetical protein